ncbi:MAG: hypothetical protein AAF519_16845 [Bacteroidota bacterium]
MEILLKKDRGKIREIRGNLSSLWISLFTSLIVFSCSSTSTETTQAEVATVHFDEDLALPNFTISTIKDSTAFSSKGITKDGILLIKYFSPDCDHCQQEAETYFSKKDSLQNIKTIWVSGDWAELKMIKKFTETYQLEQLNPIAIGKETTNFLVSYYQLQGIPYAAVYKDNQLIKEYQGALDFSELITINEGTFTPKPIVPSWLKEPNTSEREKKEDENQNDG